jgi:hypothetical protein
VAAAKEAPICLYAVADDPNAAVLAARSESVYCTLETIEGVRVAASHSHLEAFVVLISAYFALGHLHSPFPNRVIPHFCSNYPDQDQDKRYLYGRCHKMMWMQ